MSYRPAWWLGILRVLWPLNYLAARATGVPLLGKVLFFLVKPLFNSRSFNLSYIPINRDIAASGSVVLPAAVIEELIRRSAYRVTINRCSCRDSMRCESFPIEDSCLLLGEDTRHIDRNISKHLSVDAAIKHLHHMSGIGLIPMIGRVRMDDFFYGVPNRGRMLTICFCCTCCCTVLRSARFFPKEVGDSIVRLKGLAVTTDTGKCRTCGACVGACPLKSISIVNGRIARDDVTCKGCGHCASVCPEGAVSVRIDSIDDAVREIYGRINERMRVD